MKRELLHRLPNLGLGLLELFSKITGLAHRATRLGDHPPGKVHDQRGRARDQVAEVVPKSKKLLKLTVSLGSEQRTIVAGIAQHYAPADLVGKKVVVVANLEPATLMEVQSQGMVLAGSTDNDGALAVLTLDRDLPPGARVR